MKCEKGGIRRILMNLFSNSLKFTQVSDSVFSGLFIDRGTEWIRSRHASTITTFI